MKNYSSNTPESEKDCAQTPWWFIKSLQNLIGTAFDLDVCAFQNTSKAGCYYSLKRGQDGLNLRWESFNWCNPPFSDITPWIDKSLVEAARGNTTCMIMPDNTETAYVRKAWDNADTIIRMPFRLSFLRPDGMPFLDKNGKKQGPQFPCLIAVFTKLGLVAPTRMFYHDFREGFLK